MKITLKWVHQATQRLIAEAKLCRDIGKKLDFWRNPSKKLAVEELDELIHDEQHNQVVRISVRIVRTTFTPQPSL
jgi:hypothetical protein